MQRSRNHFNFRELLQSADVVQKLLSFYISSMFKVQFSSRTAVAVQLSLSNARARKAKACAQRLVAVWRKKFLALEKKARSLELMKLMSSSALDDDEMSEKGHTYWVRSSD